MTGQRERAILIPSSLNMESRDRRESTLKIGQIARAAAVFRMNRIVIYRDPEHNDSRFIEMVLRYMDTPQYLRKMLIPRREELRHVGMLPPLRTAHHPIKSESLKIGELRVGAVVESVGSDGGVWVEIGINRPIPLRTEEKIPVGQRLNVRIFSQQPLAAEPVDPLDIPHYWGFETEIVESLEGRLAAMHAQGACIVLTSRKGKALTPDLLSKMGQQGHKRDLAVAFGSPARGVDAFLSKQSMDRYEMINTIPHQGTETVRMEEALFATLALLNLVRLED